jgi:hypothetical protein
MFTFIGKIRNTTLSEQFLNIIENRRNKRKNKKYHTVRTVPISNRKIVEQKGKI